MMFRCAGVHRCAMHTYRTGTPLGGAVRCAGVRPLKGARTPAHTPTTTAPRLPTSEVGFRAPHTAGAV